MLALLLILAAPPVPVVPLPAAGVDLINTDRLDDLRAFLVEEKP
jgi:hypothetical protein